MDEEGERDTGRGITLYEKRGWEIRARANKQIKVPGAGKYDDTLELTVEVSGAGYDSMESALEGLEALQKAVAEKVNSGVMMLQTKPYNNVGSHPL